ncbi:hypothetical protein [Neokomagataea tanensis]|uniref:hypothetical protein n=1 Tax=Neokomagataea TaxID=1223423 RepID=UPI001F0EDB1B|nr:MULTISPECIES: hypothetical protein [Neokomagataea]
MRPFLVLCALAELLVFSPRAMAQVAVPISIVQVDGHSMKRFMQGNVHHADGVISVTTDSPEYCTQLETNVDSIIAEPHGVPVGDMEDARRLRAHGVKLCQNGHLRAGIERLRRALVLLEHSQGHS